MRTVRLACLLSSRSFLSLSVSIPVALAAFHLAPPGHSSALAQCSEEEALFDPITGSSPSAKVAFVIKDGPIEHVYMAPLNRNCEWADTDAGKVCRNVTNKKCKKSDQKCEELTSLNNGVVTHNCMCTTPPAVSPVVLPAPPPVTLPPWFGRPAP